MLKHAYWLGVKRAFDTAGLLGQVNEFAAANPSLSKGLFSGAGLTALQAAEDPETRKQMLALLSRGRSPARPPEATS